ncbi:MULTISPECIES: hypothetical protein [Breznakia]|uniref:Endonuclease n=1 Tax=Breznakia blatticola TaxID=1754012 RepID=A0A4R8A5U0_9FIRM|nr:MULTISPECIES: hypothetical protein [Breznakia]MDH6368133.1 hypothetical protein [Breznakia sp. PH1-1]MDH6405222.1 hypothetical protein [Breznakia sp. PF1-11]MDH6412925.1 hypothetical protein [Breznakia sp. PFB1-11]MDH6415287.1 hypothetical protein [Breznakia sp. PFB1-14]MDH6417607.1 hypothetical protein [Breznakia sp. PFB1-4]
MEYTIDQLQEAKKQLLSLIHKTSEVVKTLEAKQEEKRYKSQITLAKRRVEAFQISVALLDEKINEM